MARTPVPPSMVKNPARRQHAGWQTAPGPHPKPPRPPRGLGVAGRAWWRAAWSSAVSGDWGPVEVEIVRRAAALADEVAAGAPVAAARELRTVEDSLALTLVGRRRLRILAAEDAPVDLPARPRTASDRGRRLMREIAAEQRTREERTSPWGEK